MYYYKFVEMNSLRLEEKIVIENIYLLLNLEWNYEEVEETKKMVKMFKDSEEVIARIMPIKEIDVKNSLSILPLTEEEKKLAMIENPEGWIAELPDSSYELDGFSMGFDVAYEERFKALAKFVLKVAVYRFCMVHFPKIVTQEMTIDKNRIKEIKKELQGWERRLWVEDRFHLSQGLKLKGNIDTKRKKLRSYYDVRVYTVGDFDGRKCIVDAWEEDNDIFNIIKKLRQHYSEEIVIREDKDESNHQGIVEIENMRNLLDIMERHLCSNLTPQDITDLKENVQDWEKNAEKLSEMIGNLSGF